jgi:nicotinamidase-related amidase
VVLCGVSTVMAVQSTARDAHDRDYRVVIAEDACAAPTLKEHETSLQMLSQIATITTTGALVDLP